nr:MAG TPA: hypothetical protein [Caudoviricetes sp.]
MQGNSEQQRSGQTGIGSGVKKNPRLYRAGISLPIRNM